METLSSNPLKQQLISISLDFEILKQENKRIILEKAILESQLNFEKAKITDLDFHFKQIEAAVHKKDETITEMYSKLLCDHYELTINNSRLIHENRKYKQMIESIINLQTHKSLPDKSILETLNSETQADFLEVHNSEIGKIRSLFTEHLSVYQELNFSLMSLLKSQSVNFAEKLQTLVAYVQNLIEILRTVDHQNSTDKNDRKAISFERKLFTEDTSVFSASFMKIFNEKTLRENKFLVFCFEQLKRKLTDMKVDFPFHLLEPEFLIKNMSHFIEKDSTLFSTIDELFEENKELEKKVFVSKEMSTFGKRVKTSKITKIEEVSKGLSLLSENIKDSQNNEVQNIFQTLENEIKTLQEINSEQLEKLTHADFIISNCQSQISADNEKNKFLNFQISENNEKLAKLTQSFGLLRENLEKIGDNYQFGDFHNFNQSKAFVEAYTFKTGEFLNSLSESIFSSNLKNDSAKVLNQIFEGLNEKTRTLSCTLESKIIEIIDLKKEAANLKIKKKVENEIALNFKIEAKKDNRDFEIGNLAKKRGLLLRELNEKVELSEKLNLESMNLLNFKLKNINEKIWNFKSEIWQKLNTFSDKNKHETEEKLTIIKKLEKEIEILNLGREKFMIYLQERFKNFVN